MMFSAHPSTWGRAFVDRTPSRDFGPCGLQSLSSGLVSSWLPGVWSIAWVLL